MPKRNRDPEINLIPFIDVLLVILIFVMVSASFSVYQDIPVNLPTANRNDLAQKLPSQVILSIDAKGNYRIGQNLIGAVDAHTLAGILKKESANLTEPLLVLAADSKTSHHFVVDAILAAQSIGLQKISFLAQAPAQK
ncbi:MAG: biopolymer transporter ExbD [Gammaproteobacteria bacterium]|nr:biopolymer transporter ExbD [Gammaproteobacteria bacterium]